MLCINPYYKSEEYNDKSGSYWRPLPCGNCVACLTNRRNDWTLRLQKELEDSISAHFVTLTYNDENIYYNENNVPSIKKSHLQDFFKRLRHKTKNKIRYYAVGEYGTISMRPHYHIILFNLPHDETYHIEDSWNNQGHIHVGTVTHGSIHYVTKYHVNKTIFPKNGNPSFTTMSRRPGIGNGYIEKFSEYHQDSILNAHYTDLGGTKRRLPRYYKDKLYTDEQRAQIEPYDVPNPIEEIFEHKQTVSFKEYKRQQNQQIINQYREKINRENKF